MKGDVLICLRLGFDGAPGGDELIAQFFGDCLPRGTKFL
jgi:hypothetical protein